MRPLVIRVGADISDYTRKMTLVRRMSIGLRQTLTSPGLVAIAGIGATVAGLYTATKAAGRFQDRMLHLKAIIQPTRDEFKALSEKAKELSLKFEYMAPQVAEGMRIFGQAGFEAKEIINAMEDTIALATLGNIELARAVDIVASSLRTFGIEAKNVSEITNTLAFIQSKTNTTIAGLGTAMSYVGPFAKQLGWNIREVAAAIGVLGNKGIKGTRAGTGLRGMIVRLLNPSKKARDLMKIMGIEITNSEGKFKGLVEMLKHLKETGADVMTTSVLFGARAGPAVAALLERTSIPTIERLLEKLKEEQEYLQSAAGIMRQAWQKQATIAGSAFNNVMRALGDLWLPAATKVLKEGLIPALRSLAGWLERVGENEKVQAFFESLSNFGVRFTSTMGRVGTALQPLIEAMAGTFAKWMNTAAQTMDEWAEGLAQFVEDNKDDLPKLFKSAVGKAEAFVSKIIRGWKEINRLTINIKSMNDMLERTYGIITSIDEAISWLGGELESTIGAPAAWLGEFWANLFDQGMFQKFIQERWNRNWNWFETYVIDKLAYTFNMVWYYTGSWLKEMFESLKETLKGAWNRSWTWFEVYVLDSIQYTFNEAKYRMKKQLIALTEVIKTAFKDAWDSAKNGALQLVEDIKDAWKRLGKWLKDKYENIFSLGSSTNSGITKASGANLAKTYGQGFWQGVKSTWNRTFGAAINWIADHFESHSPTKKGPFSEIDVWGMRLAITWGEAFWAGVAKMFNSEVFARQLERIQKKGGWGAALNRMIRVEPNKESLARFWEEIYNQSKDHQEKQRALLLGYSTMEKDAIIQKWQELADIGQTYQDIYTARLQVLDEQYGTTAQIWAETMLGRFQVIEQGLANMMQAAFLHTGKLSDAFKSMVKNMVGLFIQGLARMLVKHMIHTEAKKRLTMAMARAEIQAYASIAHAAGAAAGAKISPWTATQWANMSRAAAMRGAMFLGKTVGGLPGGDVFGDLRLTLGGKGKVPSLGGLGPGLTTPLKLKTPGANEYEQFAKQYKLGAFAEGGIVTKPTLAVVGEKGPEAIVPLKESAPATAPQTITYNINLIVPEGAIISDNMARAIAEKLSDIVVRHDVELIASKAKLAEEVEPGV